MGYAKITFFGEKGKRISILLWCGFCLYVRCGFRNFIGPDFSQKCGLFGFLNTCQIFIKIRNGIINILDVLLH